MVIPGNSTPEDRVQTQESAAVGLLGGWSCSMVLAVRWMRRWLG